MIAGISSGGLVSNIMSISLQGLNTSHVVVKVKLYVPYTQLLPEFNPGYEQAD